MTVYVNKVKIYFQKKGRFLNSTHSTIYILLIIWRPTWAQKHLNWHPLAFDVRIPDATFFIYATCDLLTLANCKTKIVGRQKSSRVLATVQRKVPRSPASQVWRSGSAYIDIAYTHLELFYETDYLASDCDVAKLTIK